MPILSRFDTVEPYRTKDLSEIRELMHPDVHGNERQSLAHATIPPGGSTLLHQHAETEELYHFTQGTGIMSLGKERFEVGPGDTICIPPGTPHNVVNNGETTLEILCCCCPPYRHEDTVIL